MIQRKQTLYLFLAAVATVVCMFLPLGSVEQQGMGVEPLLYNMSLISKLNSDVQYDFSYMPLFVILALTVIIELITIFLYKNRKRQARLCSLNIALLLVWMILFVYFKYVRLTDIGVLHQTIPAYLPFLAAVLNYLAFKGIRADERLVRAADRIR